MSSVTDLFGDNPSLAEARQYVFDNLERGVQCPCCDKHAAVDWRPFNPNMARALIWLVLEAGPEMRSVLVPEGAPRWLTATNQLPTTAHWGLIEKPPRDPRLKKQKRSGWWKPTAKGVDFVYRHCRIKMKAGIYNHKVVGWSAEETDIVEALAGEHDYQDLMLGHFPFVEDE